MAEAIYKVGDILEIESQYGMFASDKKSRCLVLKCIKPGYEFIVYTILVLKSDDSFTVIGVNQKDIICTAKRVGHIDISKFLSDDEESTEPDYAILFALATIAQVADLKNENEKLKAELADEALKRKQAEAELNEKTEELDGVYHSDIVCENNKLRDENRILNEIVNGFKSTCDNCEARSENKRLKDENGKLAQKISCADNLLAEAANRLYQGRAHLNISAHN